MCSSDLVLVCSAGPVGDFVSHHPTVKMLALSFLLLIGTSLVADGACFHIPNGYIYSATGFSVVVEFLNLRAHPAGAGGPRTGPGHGEAPRPPEVQEATASGGGEG